MPLLTLPPSGIGLLPGLVTAGVVVALGTITVPLVWRSAGAGLAAQHGRRKI